MADPDDLKWAVENFEEISMKYVGKYVIIYRKKVISAEEEYNAALEKARKKCPEGSGEFVVQYARPAELLVL